MLAIRIQAIDGMGTCTPPDSQPCRLLLTRHDILPRSSHDSFPAFLTFSPAWTLAAAGIGIEIV
jgi:hypothetical protein